MVRNGGDTVSAFEDIMKKLDPKAGYDREGALNELGGECACPDCPTYNVCAGEAGERLYCFLGRSGNCTKDELGCNCPDCPVAVRADLVNTYYCITGSESEVRLG